jgi:hypothetical protein
MVTWTCARCGAVEQSLAAAQRHIAAMHLGAPLPASSAALSASLTLRLR